MTKDPRPQMAFDESVVDDPEFERLLEDRHKRKVAYGETGKDYREADDAVKGRIKEMDLEPDVVLRVGRFRITRTPVPSRSVAFDTAPTDRIGITLLDE